MILEQSSNSKVLIAFSLEELHFRQLMHVYEQSNLQSGLERYPQLHIVQQILQAEQDMYSYLKNDFFRTDGAFCAAWVQEGRYTTALRMEHYGDGVLLSALETAQEARCMGYGKKLVTAVLQYVKQRDRVPIYSHIEKGNAASISLHCSCGFRKILDHALMLDGSYLPGYATYIYW